MARKLFVVKKNAYTRARSHICNSIYITFTEDGSAVTAKQRYRETTIKRDLFTVHAFVETRKRRRSLSGNESRCGRVEKLAASASATIVHAHAPTHARASREPPGKRRGGKNNTTESAPTSARTAIESRRT